MNKNLVVLIIIVVAATIMYIISGLSTNTPVACTMEARLCPDGSSVGRTGPNCEFTPCPTVVKKPEQTEQAEQGKFCGGIAGIICPEGYDCHFDGNYPDAGGTCVKIGGDARN